jgi:TIR domain/NB-ARC domain
MEKIFISHRGESVPRDLKWAKWIADVVRHNGYEQQLIEWENPGSILGWMNDALAVASRFIVVLTPDFIKSDYTKLELWSFMAKHPKELHRIIVIVPGALEAKDIPPLLINSPRLSLHHFPDEQHEAEIVKKLCGNSPPLGRVPHPNANAVKKPSLFKEGLCNIDLPNTSYMARLDIDAQIKTAFVTNNKVALQAQGGMGKTTLAGNYGYLARHDYDLVRRLNFENYDRSMASLRELAVELGAYHAATEEVIHAHIKDYLLQNSALLILDNLENLVDFDKVKQPYGNAKLLITTREPEWQGEAVVVRLANWDKAMGASYFKKRVTHFTDADVEDAYVVTHKLGGLPLAMTQAALLMSAANETPAAYIMKFDEKLKSLVQKDVRDYHGGRSLEAAILLSLEQSEKQAAGAGELLKILTSFAPSPIPKQLFMSGEVVMAAPLNTNDKVQLAFAALVSTGLIEAKRVECDKPEWQSAYEVHRLTSVVVGAEKQGLALEMLAKHFPEEIERSEHWAVGRLLVPHITHLYNFTPEKKNEDNYSQCLNQWGRFEKEALGDYSNTNHIFY